MSEPIRYTLKHPLVLTLRSVGGEERQEETLELILRRLKGKDLRGVTNDMSEAAQALHLIGRSAGLAAAQVDELDVEDIAELGEVIAGFMPRGLLTGGNLSET